MSEAVERRSYVAQQIGTLVVSHVQVQNPMAPVRAAAWANALRKLGVDAWLVMGNDPPGSFTHVLHPGLGRHTDPPSYVLNRATLLGFLSSFERAGQARVVIDGGRWIWETAG